MESVVGTVVLIVVFAAIVFFTRKKPGRRYDEKAPERGDADLDEWGGM